MKTLLLLRHAKSSWDVPMEDHDRPLTKRGRRAAEAMGAFMAGEGLVPDAVLCSTAARARETWALIAPSLNEPPVEHAGALYLAPAGDLLTLVRNADDGAEKLLLVGHNPGMEELARRLASGGDGKGLDRMRRKFPTAALAVLRFAVESWQDVAPGTGELDRFVRPKDLPEVGERST